MAELKTKPTKVNVTAFINAVEDDSKRKDCRALLKLMKSVTDKKPVIWGTSIIGFGNYHYKYKSGREGDWPVTGFSPRKQNISIYVMPGFSKYQTLMKKLGKYKTGVSCLYVKRLDDIDQDVLRQLVEKSVTDMQKMYSCA